MAEFNVPAVDPALKSAFEARAKQADAWLARLPFASPVDAAQQLLTALHAMNRSTLDSATRDTLLALYRPALARISTGLETLLGEAGIPPHAQPKQAGHLLRTLQHELAISCQLLLAQHKPDRKTPPRQTAALLARLLMAWRDIHYAHTLTYNPLPQGLWQQIHHTHALACRTGLADTAIGDVQPASLVYRKILLMALADPLHMSRGEQLHARAYLRAYAALATLRETDTPGESGCMVAPDRDLGPLLHTDSPAGHLWLDTDVLCRQLHDTALRLRTGDSPRRLGLPATMESDLALLVAKRLSKRWRNSTPRVFKRRPGSDAILEAVAGVSAIHRLLAQGEPVSFDEDDSSLISDVGLAQTQPAAVQRSRWTLRNDSAQGLSLEGTPEAALNLKVGDALALRPADTEQAGWSLAVIRWVAMHDCGRVELGVERLASQMQPVWIRPLRGHRKHPESALFVPGLPALKQPDRLLLPRYVYTSGMDAEIWHATRQFLLSFGRRHEHTPTFDLIDFTAFA